MAEEKLSNDEWVRNKGQLQEKPFTSSTPVIGPVIVFIRSAWNSVATKWYVRPLVQQQNEYNSLIFQRLRILENRLNEQELRLIEDDRHQAQLIRETGEITYNLGELNRLLDGIEERISAIEQGSISIEDQEGI